MRHLIAIPFQHLDQAEQIRLAMLARQRDYLLQLEDLVIVYKQPDGLIHLKQAYNLTVAGEEHGSFLGLLIGLLLCHPLLGVRHGVVSKNLAAALADVGFDQDIMHRIAIDLQLGRAMLFVLAHDISLKALIAEFASRDSRSLRVSLSHQDIGALKLALREARTLPENLRLA